MSFIKHHFNNSHHCTAKFSPCFQNSVFEKHRSLSRFCKKLSKFQIPNVEAQPWSPLPKHLRSHPCKNFQEKSSFQPIYFKKGNQKSEPINSKSVITQTL